MNKKVASKITQTEINALEKRILELEKENEALKNQLKSTPAKKENTGPKDILKMYELALKASKIGIWEWNLKTNELSWDRQMYRLYGIKKKDFLGAYAAWENGLHPDDRENAVREIQEVIENHSNFDTEFRVLWPSGEVRYIHAMADILYDDEKEPIKMIGVNWDVTELRNSIERFELAERGASVGIWDWHDVKGDKETWSAKFYELLGYKDKEIKASLKNFGKLLHPDDQTRTFSILDSHFVGNKNFDLEYRLRTKQGNYKWFRGTGYAAKDKKGNPTRMVGSIEDIQERKIAEQKLAESNSFLEKVTEIVPSIIYVFDHTNMSNHYSNRSVGEIIGYTESEIQNLGDKFMPNVCHPDDLTEMFHYFEKIKTLKDGEVLKIDYRMKHKKGGYRWLQSVDIVFERNDKDEVIKHLGVATDITVIKEAEEGLKSSNKILESLVSERTKELHGLNKTLEKRVEMRTNELKRINEDLEVLAYVTTHDMRSPVNNISSYLNFLKEDTSITNPLSIEAIEWIERSVNQAQTKIQDLMDVARLRQEVGKNLEMVDVSKVIHEVLFNLNAEINQSKALIQINRIKVKQVHFSYNHLVSIFQNIIQNAIKYKASNKEPHIEIFTDEDDKHFLFHFKDNGMGIDLNKHREKVFGLFKRVNKNIPGSGIGLYMINQTMSRLGGKIEIDSRLNQGSTFTLYFSKK